VHKVAFSVGSFNIYWYGVLVALGFIIGLWTASRRAVRVGVSGEIVADLGPWLLLGTILGARLLYVVSYWREEFAAASIWEIFNIRNGGLVYYGGLIGASMAFVFYLNAKQQPLWKTADILAPSIALGYAIGRLGCLMNGCCYGYPTQVPWAVHFPGDHPTHGQNVHPTQVYESLLNLGLYGALAWLHQRKKFDGQVFASYLIGYAVLRSLVEIFRGDYPVRYGGWATPAQLVSAGILAAGFILMWRLPRPETKSSPPAP
jgi:phosphatidylglycerol:prolipoprotein diacylglycerol transferase